MIFQSVWTTNVEKEVACELFVQTSNILYSSNVECAWYAMHSMAYCCAKEFQVKLRRHMIITVNIICSGKQLLWPSNSATRACPKRLTNKCFLMRMAMTQLIMTMWTIPSRIYTFPQVLVVLTVRCQQRPNPSNHWNFKLQFIKYYSGVK